jgi:hypothetical protein
MRSRGRHDPLSYTERSAADSVHTPNSTRHFKRTRPPSGGGVCYNIGKAVCNRARSERFTVLSSPLQLAVEALSNP